MDPLTQVDPYLTTPDLLVLRNLLEDVDHIRGRASTSTNTLTKNENKKTVVVEDVVSDEGYDSNSSLSSSSSSLSGSGDKDKVDVKVEAVEIALSDDDDQEEDDHSNGDQQQRQTQNQKLVVDKLRGFNDPTHPDFEPTVFVTWDVRVRDMPPGWRRSLLESYIAAASSVVRNRTDVVMITHLLLYFSTSVPSALVLFFGGHTRFKYLHGILHTVMQVWYAGSYTLMMHQHIHQGGILNKTKKGWAWIDAVFPYVLDPLHGHTWNSYFYHHVKHHHVEGNGPDDLSSTIRYQRDDVRHFLHYWFRFFVLIWFDLPRYFLRKNKPRMAAKCLAFELSEYTCLFYLATRVDFAATFFVFLAPLLIMRIGLMIGNWGQHAFVDEVEPDSDFRSSITLIDVPSNRFCYNDGYHTSHHLNPRRHWRDHPLSFVQQKHTYAAEKALVFRNIDYLMITVKTLQKDYHHLARCLVPMGEQIGMSIDELADMLRTKTRRFTEEDVRLKFKKSL